MIDAATKVQEQTAREQPIYQALLDAVRSCIGGKNCDRYLRKIVEVQEYFSDFRGIGDPDALYMRFRADWPGYAAEVLQKALGRPRDRADIARSAASLFPPPDTFSEPAPGEWKRLSEAGFLPLPNVLTRAEVEELSNYLRARASLIEGTLEKIGVADIAAAPHALRIATHPMLLAVAGDFLGCAPTIVNIEAWYSPATGNPDNAPEQLHRDKDDFRACKFFMYLTDVEAGDGPHIYAKHSHDINFVKHLLAEKGHSIELLKDIFGMGYGGRKFVALNQELFAAQLMEIVGPAGTSFIENSYGLHRGKPVERGSRGMIAITYALVGYPSRLERFAPIRLEKLPPDCIDSPLSHHAARLLFRPQSPGRHGG